MLSTVRALKGYDDHRWAGFQQIKSVGGHVRRGEHGHWICVMRSVGGARPQARNDADLAPMARAAADLGRHGVKVARWAGEPASVGHNEKLTRPDWTLADHLRHQPSRMTAPRAPADRPRARLEDGPKSCLYI